MRTLVRSPFARLGGLVSIFSGFRGLGALALTTALVGGCASSGQSVLSEPHSIAVSLVGYTPEPFELVSESHTPAVQLYSQEHSTASTKVLTDVEMVALVEHLEGLGYRTYARAGSAPESGGGAFAKAIQVDEDGRISWWPLVESAGVAELKAFQTAVQDFLQLYNVAQSWQSVDNTLGGDYFDRKKAGH